jgi:signal transduction histidine kinase
MTMVRVTRVLLIEDEPLDAELVRRRLEERAGDLGPLRLRHAGELGEGLAQLASEPFDVVLLDLHLPDSTGIETLSRLRESAPDIPVVVFTAAGAVDTALDALRAGAQDYLVKDELQSGAVLRRAIRYAIERRHIERENRALQERVLRAEKLESLGVLGAGAAFAFNELHGGILEQVDQALVVLSESKRPDSLRASLFSIRRAAFRAAELASQLRDYVAADHGERAFLNVSELVLQLSDFLRALVPSQIELHYDLASELPPVEANALQIRQLLIALVVNASEAIGKETGTIRIVTEECTPSAEDLADAVGCEDLANRRCVRLRVSDTGRGMDEAVRARMFDPFFTTKFAGRGLGLSGALGVVRRHGGAIRVESARDTGTRVEALLPSMG